MTNYRLYQVDAFTTRRFAGNAAGVVPDAEGLDTATMQAIARELNNSETAFVFPPDDTDHDVRVRFFTPAIEVPSCGHATIATHYVRALESGGASTRTIQKIGAGLLPVDVMPVEDDYQVIMTQGAPRFDTPFPAARRQEILNAFGLGESDLDTRGPIQIVDTGHSKVLIGLQSRDCLNTLTPDLARLAALSGETRCNGYYLFTLHDTDPDVLAHGRMFAPAMGIAEDPVTGNANGPLGAYLVEHAIVRPDHGLLTFAVRQGETMGRPGTIDVIIGTTDGRPTTVQVAGRAVVAFQTTITV